MIEVAPSPTLQEVFYTPRGKAASMAVRAGTSDHNTAYSCLTEDEYGAASLELGNGWAVDIGAHIGGATVALAVNNKEAHVIAVECLSENVAMIARNVELNGITDRVTVLHAIAARKGGRQATVRWNFDGGESGQHHRFIANAQAFAIEHADEESVETIDLASVVKMAGGEVAFLKIDCEGGEYEFLRGPGLKHVAEIRGEFHAGFDRLVEQLAATHAVTMTGGLETLGAFRAVRL